MKTVKTHNKVVHKNDNGNIYNDVVVAYMRFSSENQDTHSIEYQRQAIRTYCEKENLFLSVEYWDEAYTGTDDRRPAFQKLMEDACKNPAWKTILVYDLSRWFRNKDLSAIYNLKLTKLKINLFSITEQYGTSSEGLFMTDMKNTFNAFTSRNIGKFTRDSMKTKAINGEHCGGLPPLGYDIVNKKLVINEHEAMIVRRIFDLYESNFSYNKIAEELNSRGYRTKSGNPFTYNSFSSILRQEKYTGTFVWNKTSGKRTTFRKNSEDEYIKTPDKIPAIISKEKFDKVQQMFKDRQNGVASSKNRQYYLLSGCKILKCAECGALMIGSKVTSHGISYKYYYCPTHKKDTSKCSNVGIKAKILDRYVINTLVLDISKRSDLISLYNTSDSHDTVRYLNNQIRGLKKASTNLIKEIASGKSNDSIEELRAELNDIATRKRILEKELQNIQSSQISITEADRKQLCIDIANLMNAGESLEVKQYLSRTISEIKVSNEDIEIELNIA